MVYIENWLMLRRGLIIGCYGDLFTLVKLITFEKRNFTNIFTFAKYLKNSRGHPM
jgi:hypothetical protein